MVKRQIIDEWLAKAEEDFLFAKRDLEDEDTFFALLCFHFHQSAEKYLKAFCLFHDLPLRKVHDLIELLELGLTKDAEIDSLREAIIILQPFYVDTRYPVAYPLGLTKIDAEQAYEAADKIRNFVVDKVSNS